MCAPHRRSSTRHSTGPRSGRPRPKERAPLAPDRLGAGRPGLTAGRPAHRRFRAYPASVEQPGAVEDAELLPVELKAHTVRVAEVHALLDPAVGPEVS